MGNQVKNSIFANYRSPDLSNYQLISSNHQYKVFKNKQYNQLIEEYTVVFVDNQQYENELQVLELRQTNPYLVKFCSNYHKANLYLERIPLRLCDIKDIPYPDILHITQACLKGFSSLYDKFGYFTVEEDMIGINMYGRTKIWINKNFSKSLPDIRKSDYIGREADMVHRILEILQANTDKNNGKQTFLASLQKKNNSFAWTIKKLYEYAHSHNFIIPQEMKCTQALILNLQNIYHNPIFKLKKSNNTHQIKIEDEQQQKPYNSTENNNQTIYMNLTNLRSRSIKQSQKVMNSPKTFQASNAKKVVLKKNAKPTYIHPDVEMPNLDTTHIESRVKHQHFQSKTDRNQYQNQIPVVKILPIVRTFRSKIESRRSLLNYFPKPMQIARRSLLRHKSGDLRVQFTYASPPHNKQSLGKIQYNHNQIQIYINNFENQKAKGKSSKQQVKQILKIQNDIKQQQKIQKSPINIINQQNQSVLGPKLQSLVQSYCKQPLKSSEVIQKLQFRPKNKLAKKNTINKEQQQAHNNYKELAIDNNLSKKSNQKQKPNFSKNFKKVNVPQIHHNQTQKQDDLDQNLNIKEQTNQIVNTVNMNFNEAVGKDSEDSDQVPSLGKKLNVFKRQNMFFDKVNMSQSINMNLFNKKNPTPLRQTT